MSRTPSDQLPNPACSTLTPGNAVACWASTPRSRRACSGPARLSLWGACMPRTSLILPILLRGEWQDCNPMLGPHLLLCIPSNDLTLCLHGCRVRRVLNCPPCYLLALNCSKRAGGGVHIYCLWPLVVTALCLVSSLHAPLQMALAFPRV